MLATISDKKIGVSSPQDSSLIEHYRAEVTTAQDYYPFGMKLPGRSGALSASGLWQDAGSGNPLPANPVYNSRTGNEPLEYKATETISFVEGFESGVNDAFEAYITTDNGNGSGNGGSAAGLYAEGGYRYGFNGKEQDPEISGDGNQYDYGFRIYNPRLGRFLSTDPIAAKYPELTPFQFASNSPVSGVDQDGLEYVFYKMFRNDATSEFKIVKTGEVDYGNWALNLVHKTTGWTPDYFKTPVLEYLDGKHYLFSSEKEVMSLKPGDARLSPDKTYTLEGIGALYNATDALGGVLVGTLIEKAPSEKVSPNKGRGTALEKQNGTAAQQYENTIPGSASDVATQKKIVPTLKYDNPNPNGKNFIKFDGFEPETNTFIDRKLSFTSYPKSLDQLRRASEALRQNPGFNIRYEVPDAKQLRTAVKLFRDLRITNVGVKVVPRKPTP